MPQMAPLSWFNLLISFLMIFLSIHAINYYSFKYTSTKDKTTSKIKSLTWKW